jgi:hypothetical protein
MFQKLGLLFECFAANVMNKGDKSCCLLLIEFWDSLQVILDATGSLLQV